MLRKTCACAVALCLSLPCAAGDDAGKLLGASKALERIGGAAPAATQAKADDVVALLADLDAFGAKPGAPAAAAAQWVSLYARWEGVRAKVDRTDPRHYDKALRAPLSSRSLVSRLPGPQAWPELQKLLRKRYAGNAGFDILGALLSGNGLPAALDRAGKKVVQLPQSQRAGSERLLASIRRMAVTGNDETSLLKAFELELEEKAAASGGTSRLEAPDLVTLVGPDKARSLLGKALVLPSTTVSVPVGDETRKLAQQLLIEKAAQVRVPHWGLVRAPNAKATYEALARQFPEAAQSTESLEDAMERATEDDYEDMDFGAMYKTSEERLEAQLHYLIGLIVAGEASQAEQLATRLAGSDALGRASQALKDLRQQGYAPELYAFFKALLEKRPALAAWPILFELAAETGKTEEALAVVDRALKGTGLSTAARRELRRQRVNALLAADKVGAAIDEMDQLLASADNQGAPLTSFRTELALQLMETGRLVQKPKVAQRGSSRARKELAQAWPEEVNYERDSLLLKLVKQLRSDRRLAEAEAVLLDELARLKSTNNAAMMSSFAMVDPGQRNLMVELVGIYHQAERWGDVIAFMDGVQQWGADDLAKVALLADSTKVPLGHMVARALIERGDAGAAKPILETVIAAQGGFDPAYEAYVGILGSQAIPFLERTYARDRFEERPLIWKATALVKAGQAAEAEKVARQAIGVDPSDGEQGAAHRMRAYAILADALAQRGELEGAEAYRGAIRAIRISERADELRAGRMHSRAIALYREALTQFADAYCIQSRLAIELAHAGRSAEAEQHYRRAYELMPASFGRVESHCFGCEKVFESRQAQNLAEEVFQKLLKETPEKAQVHYLMGYLRYEQGRPAEALQLFRAAVGIDPDYLNAWKKLEETGGRVHMARNERDLIALKILQLDPQQRHSSPDLDEVVDLAALWSGVDAARKQQPATPATLYPLRASAAQRAKAIAQLPEAMRDQMSHSLDMMDDYQAAARELPAPGLVLAQTKVLSAVGRLIDQGAAPAR